MPTLWRAVKFFGTAASGTSKQSMHFIRTVIETPLQSSGVFLLVFFLSATLLHLIDFYPEPVSTAVGSDEVLEYSDSTLAAAARVATEEREDAHTPSAYSAPSAAPLGSRYPTRIVIPKIGVNTPIENPTSSDLATLDNALLKGAVRYPGSALLGQEGIMFLFGHQSGLPVVRNPAFKAFNDIQKLNAGDVIRVLSPDAAYEYRVLSVSLVEAEEALIPLSGNGRKLFLSTCNSFGDPGERYVVEAEFVAKSALH